MTWWSSTSSNEIKTRLGLYLSARGIVLGLLWTLFKLARWLLYHHPQLVILVSSLISVLTSVEDHIKSICKSSHYHIRNIAFVTAKLDSCNSVLYGLPQHLILRLQAIQHTVAGVVTRTRKFDHITSVLKQLHCLPVRYLIVFKILSLVFKALNGTAPYVPHLGAVRSAKEQRLRRWFIQWT